MKTAQTVRLAFLAIACLGCSWARAGEITVYAAASLTDALQAVAVAYKAERGEELRTVFAASSILARQIEAGAPAQVFVSADQAWMDYLQDRNRIEPATRVDLLGNSLVLVVPRGRPFRVAMEKSFDFAGAFNGHLCTGDTDSVPAGIYARESLQALGWWPSVSSRIVGTDDVRTALAFVERGECAAGVVYATDAAISDRVEVLARFPESTHKPVVYPVAALRGAAPSAAGFLDFLKTGTAAAIFARYGFVPLATARPEP
jgi:molybdate transport system substrate-binding protein